MALFSKKQYEDLARKKGKYCLSVYIPSNRTGSNKEARIMLKNRIADSDKKLAEMGIKENDRKKLLKPLEELLDESLLWRNLSDALVIFRSNKNFFHTTLPIDVEETSYISDRFYLLPLHSIFNNQDQFFLLVLSMNENHLYLATQREIDPILTEGKLPRNMEDSVGRDVRQKSLQYRVGHTRRDAGMFHGHGEGKDDKKTEVQKYLREVDSGLQDILEGYNIPLVVVSVEYLFSIFREITSYKNLYPQNVPGNHDDEDIFLIHEKACDMLQPYFEASRKEKKDAYVANSDKTTSKIDELIVAAESGSIDTLFVRKNACVWGNYEKETGAVNIHEHKEPVDYCLLDFAAQTTFLQGGKVFLEEAGELPEANTQANAILRY